MTSTPHRASGRHDDLEFPHRDEDGTYGVGALGGECRSPAFAPTLIGFLSQLTSIVLTGRFELPINAGR